MALTTIKSSIDGVTQVITLDCNLGETHDFSSEVTDNPIEDGSTIVDNVVSLPTELTIDAVLYGEDSNGSTSKERFAILNTMRREGRLLVITTPFDAYDNMLITSLSLANTIEDSAFQGNIRFSMSVKNVVIVNSLQSTVTPSRYKKKVKRGKPKWDSKQDKLEIRNAIADAAKAGREKRLKELSAKKIEESGRVNEFDDQDRLNLAGYGGVY